MPGAGKTSLARAAGELLELDTTQAPVDALAERVVAAANALR